MNGTDSLSLLVRRARRRRASNGFIQRSAMACGAGLGALLLLLIIGTDILNWYWPVLFCLSLLAVLAWRARRPRLSDYEIAQDIDARLGFHDSLSTALYFRTAADHGSPEIVDQQRRVAEEHARTADLTLAIPVVVPRSVYVSGGLAVMVFGLFAARYGMTRSLDLHPSLLHIAFGGAPRADSPGNELAANERQRNRHARQKDDTPLDPVLASDPAGVPGAAQDGSAKPLGQAAAPQPGGNSPTQVPLNGGESPGDASAQNNASQAARRDSSEQDGTTQAASSGMKPGGTEEGQPQTGAQNRGAAQENNSLMDRMRDAMAGLLSKLRMQQNTAESRASALRNGSPGNGSSRSNGPGMQSQGRGQEGSLSPDGQKDAQGNAMTAQQTARGHSDARGADSAEAPDSKSGIGRQDGSKDPKLAEQLAAMGRISEIIGRRSRSVTGEVMVEVPSGSEQQLRTAYSGKRAAHGDSNGEISRDEVPLMYQQYVQDYFDQIRKLPAPKQDSRR